MLESAEKVRIDAFSEEAKGKGVNELNLKLNYKFDGKGEKMDLTQLINTFTFFERRKGY